MSETSRALGLRKALIDAETANRVEDIVSILGQLKTDIKVTEALLRETRLGATVGKLRKHESQAVVSLAHELVKKWKEDVGSSRPPKVKAADGTSQSPAQSGKPAPAPVAAPEQPAASTSDGTSKASQASKPKPVEDVTPLPSPLEPGKARTTVTDKVRTEVTDDKTRNNCIRLLYDTLATGSLAASTLVLERAKEVESGAWRNKKDEGWYRSKMRSLMLTLKAKDNPELRAAVIAGEVEASQLWSMSAADLASAEKKAELAKMHEQALFDAQAAAPKKSSTDMFECGKCRKRRASYYQMQTRSADEPMTTFVECLECGHKWRFS